MSPRIYREPVFPEGTDGNELNFHSLALLRALYSNIGDLAIYKGTLNVFSELGIKPKYIFDPEPSFPEGYLQNYNLNLIYTFPTLLEQELQKNRRNPANYLRPTLHLPNELIQMHNLKKKIKHLFCLGGARFGDRFTPHVIGEILNAYSKTRLLNAKLIIGGISIASQENNYLFKKIYQKFLNQVTHLFVRDNISYDNLRKYHIPSENCSIICDFAYWLDPMESACSVNIKTNIDEYSNGSPVIGIAPGMDISSMKMEYKTSWCHLIRTLNSRGYSIVLIPTSHNPKCLTPPYDKDDYSFCQSINSELGFNLPIIQTKKLEPEEIIELMKKFACVISSRMHGAIFSTIANVPTIHIYNEKKGLGLFDTFFKETVSLYSFEHFLDYDKSHPFILGDLEGYIDANDPYSHTIHKMKEASQKKLDSVFIKTGLIR